MTMTMSTEYYDSSYRYSPPRTLRRDRNSLSGLPDRRALLDAVRTAARRPPAVRGRQPRINIRRPPSL